MNTPSSRSVRSFRIENMYVTIEKPVNAVVQVGSAMAMRRQPLFDLIWRHLRERLNSITLTSDVCGDVCVCAFVLHFTYACTYQCSVTCRRAIGSTRVHCAPLSRLSLFSNGLNWIALWLDGFFCMYVCLFCRFFYNFMSLFGILKSWAK